MLFITSFLENDQAGLYSKLSLVLVMWLVVLAAIVIDLISGVHKARSMGVTRTSYGFRRTVSKVVQYYSVMVFALMFDIIASLVVTLPYFTMLASAFLVFIEAISVYEKAEEKVKNKAAGNLADLITLLENKDDLMRGLAQVLKNKTTGDETESRT